MSTPLPPSIGQPVRVRLSDGSSGSSCRATVAYVDAGEGTVDVVYEDAEWGREEESQVAFTRLRALEPFEMENEGEGEGADPAAAALAAAARRREEANALFRLGDYGAALARYREALRRLMMEVCPSSAAAAAAGANQEAAGEGGCCAGLRVGR